MDFILYHNNCQDGWCAAYIAAKRWPNATLLPLSYGMTLEKMDSVLRAICEKDVIMVDFSLPTREAMDELAGTAKSLRVYDHHISKKEILEGLDYAVFDNERSGAGLAWDYLFGKDSNTWNPADPTVSYRPWWVNYSEDQDLWKWQLANSRTINAFLMVQPRTVEGWDNIASMEMKEAFSIGLGAQARNEFDVRALFNTVQEGFFKGHKYGVVNTSVAVSEVGEMIYNSGYDIALSWYERADGQISFGLRSLTVDVSAIAKTYGGGGHKASAGFETNIEQGRHIVDAILGRIKSPEVPQRGPFNRCS